MAGDNKTEKATPRRRQKAREQGQVARSRELPSALAFAAACVVVAISAARWPQAWKALVGATLNASASGRSIELATVETAKITALWCAPMAAAALGAAIAGSFAQGGMVFAPAALQPKLERISPVARMKNFLSITALTQMVKSLGVAAVLGWVSWSTVEPRIQAFLNSAYVTPAGVMRIFAATAFALAWKAGLVLTVWAAVDYLATRWKHERDLRMSKDDLKQEYKESEGNPQMKARIRRLQRQQRRRQMLDAVKRATVVVTNPTHYAVALDYGPMMGAPVVLAKGRDSLAQQIKQVAHWHEVPMIENIALAHALYRTAEVGQAIPARLYSAVAEILAFVYRAQAEAGRGKKQ
jgi:flagellar biosynthesis protein FlhB